MLLRLSLSLVVCMRQKCLFPVVVEALIRYSKCTSLHFLDWQYEQMDRCSASILSTSVQKFDMVTESVQGWLRQAKHAVIGKPTPTTTAQRIKVLFDGDVITHFNKYVKRVGDANPLNVILGLVALYIFVRLIKPNSIARLTPTLAQARSSAFNANTSYSFLPDQHPPSTVWKKYTPRTLAVHDGSGTHVASSSSTSTTSKGKSGRRKVANDAADNRILLAIDGRVFDVSRGANFYGPGGPYGNFAGRDASRGMAKQSFDLEMLTPLDKPIDTLTDLTPMEVNNMREWIGHFSGKYTIVGELVNEGEEGE